MLLFEQQRSSSRAAIRKMTVQQATDALSHCKTQLQDAQTDRDALMQARASMIALDDRHWGRNSRINEQIRERTDRIGWLDWLCNEYERHVQRRRIGEAIAAQGDMHRARSRHRKDDIVGRFEDPSFGFERAHHQVGRDR